MKRFIITAAITAAFTVPAAAIAGSISPATFEATIAVGGSVTVSKTVTTDAIGASKGRLLPHRRHRQHGRRHQQRQEHGRGPPDSAASTYADIAFGVGSYDGDPLEGVPLASPPSTNLTAAYSRQSMITTNTAQVQAAINTWAAGGGGDGPEANFFALHQVATSAASRMGSAAPTTAERATAPDSRRAGVKARRA
ncbi:hypothetical protein [Thauera humireducens]|uniref:hypothetical protein n=1 Tax=Thauera humireducens TaxID=1134435 RepID=UPI00311FC0B4